MPHGWSHPKIECFAGCQLFIVSCTGSTSKRLSLPLREVLPTRATRNWVIFYSFFYCSSGFETSCSSCSTSHHGLALHSQCFLGVGILGRQLGLYTQASLCSSLQQHQHHFCNIQHPLSTCTVRGCFLDRVESCPFLMQFSFARV